MYNLINKKISNKMTFWLLILILFSSVAILFSTLIRVSDEKILNNTIIISIILELIAILIIFFIVNRVTKPIDGLNKGFEELLYSNKSHKDLKLTITESDEIGEVAILFNKYMDKLSNDLNNDAKKFADSIINSQSNIIITSENYKALKNGNKAFFDFFNVKDVEEFKNKYGSCICDTFQQDDKYDYIQKYMGKEKWHEYIIKRPESTHKVLIKKDNTNYIFHITASQFTIGDITYNTSSLLNITELENTQRELENLNKTLEKRVEEEMQNNLQKELILFEQSKLASMGAMIGNIAHQWRQPLNTISIIASGIKTKQELDILEDEDIQKDMDNIEERTKYLSETITTFRNFLKEKKELKELILQDRINISLNIAGLALQDNGIDLNVNIDYENPIKITMVTGELDEVIINIINNARDILLEKDIKTPWVEINLKKENNKAIITIEDNGCGIPEAILPKIFNEYFTTKDEDKGTGLGLYMSYKIIKESLNGKLYAKNTQNGAKFYIELPLS